MTSAHAMESVVSQSLQEAQVADYGDLAPSDRRAGMLEATMTVIALDDVSGVTMDAIAKVANISRVTLYREFGNRTALLEAAIAYRLMQFDRRFFERVSPTLPLNQLIEDYLLTSIRVSKRNASTNRWTRGGMSFLRPNSSVHRTAVATWTPVVARHSEVTAGPSISPEDLAGWVNMLQYSFARLAIEADLDERDMRKRIRAFVSPAFPKASLSN